MLRLDNKMDVAVTPSILQTEKVETKVKYNISKVHKWGAIFPFSPATLF